MTANRVQPWLDDGDLQLYHGDALTVLQGLPSGIAQTCCTSPPYWGLRDYGTGQWTGGAEDCDHHEAGTDRGARAELPNPPAGWAERAQGAPHAASCRRCGARRVDSQLGLEATPTLYVENMVALFREVRRVLRDDGTLWLNLGDSYNTQQAGNTTPSGFSQTRPSRVSGNGDQETVRHGRGLIGGLKPKDLVGIPWRVAFALQADGWYLRSDIIWSKPNPMPESVTDRPTKAHEYLFLFSKQPRYFYDADAIREDHARLWDPLAPNGHSLKPGATYDIEAGKPTAHVRHDKPIAPNPAGRNRRSVWTIPTQPFPEAHFATYPEELVRPCILAGTSERGECVECGAPWRRMVERGELVGKDRGGNYNGREAEIIAAKPPSSRLGMNPGVPGMAYENTTTGWAPSCSCLHPSTDLTTGTPLTRPQLVLDPFIGSGTTALVARKHGRRSLGIDLSAEYLAIAAKRTQQLSLLGGAA